MSSKSSSPDNSVIFVGEYRRTLLPPTSVPRSLSETSDIVCLGEAGLVLVSQPSQVNATMNDQDTQPPLVLPKSVQQQWAMDQVVAEEAESDPSECLIYDLGSSNSGAAPAQHMCSGHIPLMCKCYSSAATGDSPPAQSDDGSTSPYSAADDIFCREMFGGVKRGIQQSGAEKTQSNRMSFDLAMPAPAQWEDPVPNLCCGQVPYICRCDAQGTSGGATSRAPVRPPTPYPKPGEAEHLAAFSATRFTHETEEGDDKENVEPTSGRSTPLGEFMDWYEECDLCATPEVEYTPATSPWEGRPPKRRLLELKPSLVGEVQPTIPSFPSPSPTQSAANTAGSQPSAAAEAEPQLTADCARQPAANDVPTGPGCLVTPISGSCDGFRVLFKNGAQVILTGIVLVGASFSIKPVGHQMLRLRFAKSVTGQKMPEQYVGLASEVEPQEENQPAPKVSSLTNLRLELAPECYVIIGSITLKGASFGTYQDEDGSVVVDLDGF